MLALLVFKIILMMVCMEHLTASFLIIRLFIQKFLLRTIYFTLILSCLASPSTRAVYGVQLAIQSIVLTRILGFLNYFQEIGSILKRWVHTLYLQHPSLTGS